MTDQTLAVPARAGTADDGRAPAAGPGTEAPVVASGERGRRQSQLGRLRGDISPGLKVALSVFGLVVLVAGWHLLAARSSSNLLPTPSDTWQGGVDLYHEGDLIPDVKASTGRSSTATRSRCWWGCSSAC